jgi:outer membrane protein OmpA-like peptidoglycan-associated protein
MSEFDDAATQPMSCGENPPGNLDPEDTDDPSDSPSNPDASSSSGTIGDSSEFVIVGEHSRSRRTQLLVAPSTTSPTFNVIGIDLIPVACFGLANLLFEFDSSFVLPHAGHALNGLPKMRKKKADKLGRLPLLSVFGHADPVGNEEYNKILSGRRARAIYGLLTGRASHWEALIEQPFGGDNWTAKKVSALMAQTTGLPASTPRTALIQAYMAALFPSPFNPTDFLGRGSDPRGKADFQGCCEFNPLLILSTDDAVTLSDAERNRLNLPSRRVLIYLFDPSIKLDPNLWPCPRASEPAKGCKDRFFLDANARLAPGPERREHRGPADRTFACRFYSRIAKHSPCERLLDEFRIRLFDPEARPLPFAPWCLTDSKRTRVGRADSGGFLTFLAAQPQGTCALKWSRPPDDAGPGLPDPAPDDDFDFGTEVHLNLGDEPADMQKRLENLAYDDGPATPDDIRRFQKDYSLAQTGALDAPTMVALKKAHDTCDPNLKGQA